MPWREVQRVFGEELPDVIDKSERDNIAHNNVVRAMNEIMGMGKWAPERRAKNSGPGTTLWIVLKTDAPAE